MTKASNGPKPDPAADAGKQLDIGRDMDLGCKTFRVQQTVKERTEIRKKVQKLQTGVSQAGQERAARDLGKVLREYPAEHITAIAGEQRGEMGSKEWTARVNSEQAHLIFALFVRLSGGQEPTAQPEMVTVRADRQAYMLSQSWDAHLDWFITDLEWKVAMQAGLGDEDVEDPTVKHVCDCLVSIDGKKVPADGELTAVVESMQTADFDAILEKIRVTTGGRSPLA